MVKEHGLDLLKSKEMYNQECIPLAVMPTSPQTTVRVVENETMIEAT